MLLGQGRRKLCMLGSPESHGGELGKGNLLSENEFLFPEDEMDDIKVNYVPPNLQLRK
jgi:hypothetical protein